MTSKITSKDVHEYASRIGVKVYSSAPGDGVRRYSMETPVVNGHVTRMCHGAREAFLWLEGVEAGLRRTQ